MAYEFTFTPRFQKNIKGLTVQEKKQLKNKLELPGAESFPPVAAHQADSGHHRPVRVQRQHGHPHYLVL